MAHTYLLERTQVIHRPLAEVFGFFSDAANLERITPASLRFEILSPQPIVMRPGTVMEYKIRLFGVPFRWKTLIETFEPMQRFSDIQTNGPYKLWHHTHEFYEVEGGTQVVDRVRYQIPLGIVGRFAHWLFVRRQLKGIFDFRRQKVDEIFTESAASEPLIHANQR